MILHVLSAMVAGWINRHQHQVIAYLQAENHVLKAQHGSCRLRLTDTERRRLAALAHPLGRQRLNELATLATPNTLMRWYKRLIADKFDGSKKRKTLGRPRVAEDVEQLVMRMAQENPTWGYRRIQGALANLGHGINKPTVRNILRRHHIEPAPQRRKAGMDWAQFLNLHLLCTHWSNWPAHPSRGYRTARVRHAPQRSVRPLTRPDRYEPRACKRRPKPYPLLRVPRQQARARLATAA